MAFFDKESGKKYHTPEQTGEYIYRVATQRSPPARIAAVAGKFMQWTVPMMLPHRLIDRVLKGVLGWK